MGSGEPAVPENLRSAVEQILQRVSVVTDEPALKLDGEHAGRNTRRTLQTAERLLADRLVAFQGSGTAESQLAAVLVGVQAAHHAVKEAELARRTELVKDVRRGLERLRSATSIAELVEQIPLETTGLGFRRCLVSRLDGPDWSARSAFACGDPWLTEELLRIGTGSPGRLGRELPETEAVRRRAPVLVHDAQHIPRGHRELITVSGADDYIAAPLIVRGDVVGLVHVDRHMTPDPVDAYDQEILGLFVEGLGASFERVHYQEQLTVLRHRLEDQAKSVTELVEGQLGFATPASRSDANAAGAPQSPLAAWKLQHTATPWPLSELTRREGEVLEHLVEGESNLEIAAKLYVSAETVKTHVKNLLRKLGASNRGQAVMLVRELTRDAAG